MYTSTIVLFMCAILCVYVKSQEITAMNPKQEVTVGSQASLECQIADLNLLSDIVIFYKVGLNSPDKLKPISKHTALETEYESLMEIKVDAKGKLVVFVITIKAIAENNDGKYMCAVLKNGQRAKEDYMELVVLKPVTEVKVQFGTTTSTDDSKKNVIEQREFTPVPFTCTVKGGNPAPLVTMMIGDDNITSIVLNKSEVTLTPIVRGSDFDGIRSWTYQLRSSKIIQEDYLDRKLSCSAVTPGTDQTPMVASAMIVLNEAPTFKCEDQTVVIGSKLTLTCLIYHKIKPVASATWVEQNRQIVIVPGEEVDGYTARIEPVDNQTVKAILDIEKISDKENIFQIEVNHLGWRLDHKVRVDTIPVPEPSADGKSKETKQPTGDGDNSGFQVTVTPALIFITVILASLGL